MPHFRKTIHIEGVGYAEAYFNRIFTVNGLRYHVSVQKPGTTAVHFTMEAKNNEWRIIEAPAPPEWVKGIEGSLSKAIIEHLMTV